MPEMGSLARTMRILIVLLFVFSLNSYADSETDVLVIGGGIMSATLATLVHELEPALKIDLYERLDQPACESSGTLNNAGSGHAALCELNYTPLKADGTVDTSKAVQINREFEMSKEFWSFLAHHRALAKPETFIHPVPHMSWVRGLENVAFLRKRFEALKQIPYFKDLEFTDDPAILREWMPVMMKDREISEPMAATRSLSGTDVDYGRLTQLMIQNLSKSGAADVFVQHEVRAFEKQEDGTWRVRIKDLRSGLHKWVRTKFVFIGAGGGSLLLLQKSGIAEAAGYGGFPVSGEFLMYKGHDLSNENFAKVYGQAAVGAPPMSVPHLDTRIIDGEKRLVFGPFAGATMKFLKQGSNWDLMQSLRFKNTGVMLQAGAQNLGLVEYLMNQEMQSHEDRMKELRVFLPKAKSDEWELITAGMRVQIIKNHGQGNVLQFGTEVVTSADGTLSALLGASPGASTSVAAMLKVLEKSFSRKMQTEEWRDRIKEMIPSYSAALIDESSEARRVRTAKLLSLPCEHLIK